jgi:hypothetical protein
MAEVHHLPVQNQHGTAVGSLRPVSATLQDLLTSAGFKPVAPSREKEELAAIAATLLEGSYRNDAAASAEVFHLGYVMTLAEYPDDCIRHVTDPRTGIQSFKYMTWRGDKEVRGPFMAWPPNPGELQQACEKYMAPILRRQERDRVAAEQARAAAAEAERFEAAAPAMVKAIENYRATRAAGPANFVDDLAARVMRSIDSGASARRIEEDLARRRQARGEAA